MLDSKTVPTCGATNFQCFEVEKDRKKPLQREMEALER